MTLWHIVFPSSIPSGLSIHWWALSEPSITLVFEKWLFSTCFSTSVSWHSFKFSFSLPSPPFLCFVVVVELWTHAFMFICCVIINESFYLVFRLTTFYSFWHVSIIHYVLLLCGTAGCPRLTCISPSLALESAVSRSLVSFGGSGI